MTTAYIRDYHTDWVTHPDGSRWERNYEVYETVSKVWWPTYPHTFSHEGLYTPCVWFVKHTKVTVDDSPAYTILIRH